MVVNIGNMDELLGIQFYPSKTKKMSPTDKADLVVSVLNNYLESKHGCGYVESSGFGFDDNEPEKLLFIAGDDVCESASSMEDAYQILLTHELNDLLVDKLYEEKGEN